MFRLSVGSNFPSENPWLRPLRPLPSEIGLPSQAWRESIVSQVAIHLSPNLLPRGPHLLFLPGRPPPGAQASTLTIGYAPFLSLTPHFPSFFLLFPKQCCFHLREFLLLFFEKKNVTVRFILVPVTFSDFSPFFRFFYYLLISCHSLIRWKFDSNFFLKPRITIRFAG